MDRSPSSVLLTGSWRDPPLRHPPASSRSPHRGRTQPHPLRPRGGGKLFRPGCRGRRPQGQDREAVEGPD
jgi:hypothetical protein